ncbi:hypothetical protein [uncultured Massilia sp.]|uniref:hypothetical protein n=1 Tax=uncultured Massilia sp. TaxID=169973 RepID=UPI0025D0A8D8|nr:hypothetical protein [uncultured Massilia sp.]
MIGCLKAFATGVAALLLAAPPAPAGAAQAGQAAERPGPAYRIVAPEVPVHAINNRGQAIGNVVTATGVEHGFIETDGVRTDIGSLGGYSRADALNDRGEVAGVSLGVDGLDHLVLYADGVLRDLGPLGASARVVGLNERGEIAGNHVPPGRDNVPFLYTGGRLRELVPPDKTNDAFAQALNARGQVAGSAATEDAVVWQGDRIDVIGTRIAGWSRPADINDRGDVVGTAALPGSAGPNDGRAFLYRGGRTVDLGTLGGPFAYALAVNNRGQVVGGANVRWLASDAFLYEHGVMRNLNDLVVPGTGWRLEAAVAINDRGQILSWATRGTDEYRIVRLEPLARPQR